MVTRSFKLRNGAEIPSVGLGTWQLEDQKGHDAVVFALLHGYKLIDGAFSYFNQNTIGEALKDSGFNREDYYLIEKLANTWHSAAEECLLKTLENVGTDYLDVWLMHWPAPLNHHGNDRKSPHLSDGSVDFEPDWDYLKTWKIMVALQKKYPDKIKALGVANFGISELKSIISETGVIPVINQVELHPACNQRKLFDYCKTLDIQLVGYSPLGSIGSPLLKNADLKRIAMKNNITVAQCLLSWGVANGWAVIPRSSNPSRILQNIELVDLSQEDFDAITKIGRKSPARYCVADYHKFDPIE